VDNQLHETLRQYIKKHEEAPQAVGSAVTGSSSDAKGKGKAIAMLIITYTSAVQPDKQAEPGPSIYGLRAQIPTTESSILPGDDQDASWTMDLDGVKLEDIRPKDLGPEDLAGNSSTAHHKSGSHGEERSLVQNPDKVPPTLATDAGNSKATRAQQNNRVEEPLSPTAKTTNPDIDLTRSLVPEPVERPLAPIATTGKSDADPDHASSTANGTTDPRLTSLPS
jgi:hypothetical protein